MTPDNRAEDFVASTRKIVQILRYGPRELALALLGFLLLGAIPLLPKLAEPLPFLTPALPWITGVLVVLGLFLLGFAAWRIWKKAVAPLPEAKPKPAAIKGPAPFGPQDAELFTRLGRNDDLNRLRDWILDDQKPLVALMGESGVGKTSLLRAGLAHHLQDDKVPVLYWEAVPTEPEAKLLHAVRLGWEDEEKAPKAFEDLAAAMASGRRVVVIDQAEQLSPAGHPRIFDLLRQVAAGDPPYRATWVVAFRREFLPVWRDFELSLPEAVQRRMETLSLQRFSPKAAEKVIAVLAEEGSLPVDQKLVEELVEGVAVEGKVSPADIGISLLVLSELAGGRPDASLSLDDFRESGGQAGLLTRYLERLLEQLPDSERPEVLRGLLSLVDLEKDQRLAEGRTLPELEEAARPASPARFGAALRFFASGKARVLEELPGEPVRYRLVHERLIPAIRKLTGVLLAEAERAGLALERGYRVWVQDRRHLLPRWDLKGVLRYKDQIQWGKDEADKRELVRLSLRRTRRNRFALIAATLALFVAASGLIQYSQKREHLSLLATWGLPADLYDHLGQFEELTLPGTVTRLDWLRSAKRLKKLTVEDGVLESLEGVPATLETLAVGESRLSDLSGLPPSLTSLTLGANRIRTFAGLSNRLSSLDLVLNNDSVLGTLPRSLESLRLVIPRGLPAPDLRRLESLQSFAFLFHSEVESSSLLNRLPPGLRSLGLDGAYGDSFDDFPKTLRSLSFQGTRTPPLSELPPGIESLELDSFFVNAPGTTLELGDGTKVVAPEIDGSHLRELRSLTVQLPSMLVGGVRLRRLPSSLISLKVVAAWVVLSEQLPRGLKELEIEGRFLGVGRDEDLINRTSMDTGNRIPDLRLPSGLESLSLFWSPPTLPGSLKRLKVMDLRGVALPVGLRSLDLSHSQVLKLPEIPDGLTELNLLGTRVRELPGNLQRLTSLDISFTQIDTLDDLPPSLKSLGLGVWQIETLEGLPESVTALHFHSG
ncbi:MAG TPA: AAA family ATPase [Thermoanaerobaculia bacterium]|nr:AAA family ATPase [Thermoanaerobaculia bacterium]